MSRQQWRNRKPKIFENTKMGISVFGGHTSDVVIQFFSELSLSKKPFSVMYIRK